MRTFFEAATTYPVFPFTVAMIVVVCFWLLVAVGAAPSGSFDDDADAEVWGLGGVPVSVGFSLVTGAAWLGSLCAAVLLDPLVLSGPVRALTGIAVLIAAPLFAWRVARVLVRPLHRLFPDEPGPSVPGEARTGDAIGLRDADSQDPRWGTSRDTALHPRDRAA
ncbi:DUF6332 family protein [Streptomyces europaeiscabiei]|uniref:DUF6332 family protein n=1 Tax=Streptomyces europaeiscabiei TaxID=146819 RepID=UPI0007C79675|nr:DUF6332 family protein [Streptomyces europaeiscabiei]MDX2757446.1 hypothetical protein [Streptomyces europaeiscabiei]MDX3867903.1 hypothetical protein [Streptomyces europaeiscabiei]MDX3876540.1 hypothetical protein [Streptomyces europaeiscabiei]